MHLLNTKEAAQALNVSERRIRAMVKAGQIAAVKVSRDWAFSEDEIRRLAQTPRPPGRPKKKS